MAQLRQLVIAAEDPARLCGFYREVFELDKIDEATWRNRFILMNLTRIAGTVLVLVALGSVPAAPSNSSDHVSVKSSM